MRVRLEASLSTRVQRNLAGFERRTIELEGRRAAAVALALVSDAAGEACFVLTRRTGALSNHGGQFALPGGRLDPGESPQVAARRELHEELGMHLSAEHELGLLDDYATRSGFVITPVVLWAAHLAHWEPNPHEVAVAYRVPLRQLYAAGVPQITRSAATERELLSLPLLGTQIHSPTASIVFQFREVALEGRATRVADYDQPLFAWK